MSNTKVVIPLLPVLAVATACLVAAKVAGWLTCSWWLATILLWAPPLVVLAIFGVVAGVVGLAITAIAVFGVAGVALALLCKPDGKRP